MPRFDTESERELRKYLRAHWKSKYKTLVRAADFLECRPQFLTQIHKGRKWPTAKILAEAGITVTIRRVVEWECKSVNSDNRERV